MTIAIAKFATRAEPLPAPSTPAEFHRGPRWRHGSRIVPPSSRSRPASIAQFVWMPINPRATADECIANIEAFDAKWLFIDARFSADLKKIAELATNLQGIVVVN